MWLKCSGIAKCTLSRMTFPILKMIWKWNIRTKHQGTKWIYWQIWYSFGYNKHLIIPSYQILLFVTSVMSKGVLEEQVTQKLELSRNDYDKQKYRYKMGKDTKKEMWFLFQEVQPSWIPHIQHYVADRHTSSEGLVIWTVFVTLSLTFQQIY